MPRPKSTIPAYRLHKASGQAVCYVNRQVVYLGRHGTPESRRAYSELVARLNAETSAATTSRNFDSPRTVSELLLKYATEHLPKYSRDEQACQRGVIRIVRELFGEVLTDEFGPLKLRICRDAMMAKGWSVGYVNRQVKRLRRIFRIGVSWEYVAQTVADSLGSVPALDDAGIGSRQRQAISQAHLDAVREAFTRQLHRDLFDLLLLTGARSGELLKLTSGDIDRSDEVWRAEVKQHKTRRFGKLRVLFFNTKAQLILRRYLQANPEGKLFSIRRDVLSRVFRRACQRAGVPEFTPHWLRHTVATRLADDMGTEAAQRLLGHAGRAMTEHYATKAEKLAREAATRLG